MDRGADDVGKENRALTFIIPKLLRDAASQIRPPPHTLLVRTAAVCKRWRRDLPRNELEENILRDRLA